MKFEIGNNVIASYKRLSYEAWYAFAEFIDNSTQAYFDNRPILDRELERTRKKLKIAITYDRDEDFITIEDNSIGMNEKSLDRAIKVGLPPERLEKQRSKYGLGMKTAACWFGNNWTIRTKKLGEENGYEIKIDVDAISKEEGDVDLIPDVFAAPKEDHYTIITIRDLNRKFVGRTIHKIKEFLSSIYRFDISEGIEIYWNGSKLTWQGFDNELHITEDGIRYKKQFEFEINGKPVSGWVGVLGKGQGSRKKTGFSIIQNKRVIQGWPNGYKPSSIFGDQEDGSNDLVNQRLVGELFLDKFSVSHTKDKIVWESDEEEELDKKLGEVCQEARELALTLRFRAKTQKDEIAAFKEQAVTVLESELKSSELTNYLKTTQPYPEKVIEASYKKNYEKVKDDNEPSIKVTIGADEDSILVLVYFNEVSEFEPYILTETAVEHNKVIVIVNTLHPHVQEMKSPDSFLNFIRHCIYDGVAEWKALKLRGTLQPFTIKLLKDGLLRIPFEIKSHQAV